MNDREESLTPVPKMSDRDMTPHKGDESPRNHKGRSYSRSISRGRKVYRDDHDRDGRRDRERDDRRYRSHSRSPRSSRRCRSSKCSRSRSRSRSRGAGGGPNGGGRGVGGGGGGGGGANGGRRSHSHSPMSSRRRHTGTRDNPKPSRCLGIFGLSVYTTEDELHHIFGKYGPVERVQVVIDAKTGRSRGFSFVYFENTDDAKVAKDECNGIKINGKSIRVDFSITQRAHTPTPGIYMGKPTYVFNDRWDRRGRDRDRESSRYRRSPSPYYRERRSRRYDRSRSRSYSQRRY